MDTDSFSLSFSEEEDLQDSPDVATLIRIANGEDAASDLDESNAPTELYDDDMEQGGNGVTHTREQPIIISDDSEMDSEDEEEDIPGRLESVIGTVSLRPVRGPVELNKYVFSAFLGMAAVKVNIEKLSRRKIDFYCKNYEADDDSEDRMEGVNGQSSRMVSMSPTPPETPRKSSSSRKSESKSRLSSSKKKMSAVKKRAEGRAKRSMFDVDSDPCPSPSPAKRRNSKEEEADLMSFGSPTPKPRESVVNTPTQYKLKQPKVVIRHTKQQAKVLRNLSQEYSREEVEEETAEGDKSSLDHDLRMDLPPPISKSQSDIFSSQTLKTTVIEAPSQDPSMLGRLINENLSSDEDEGANPEHDHEKSEGPSLIMDISRDLFSQSQEDGADVNANPPPPISTVITPVLSLSSPETPTKYHGTNKLHIDDAPSEEEEYQCFFCDKTFTEKMDLEEHLKGCRPGSFLSPASPKQKRPRSPSPSPLSPVPVKTVPRSPPPRSAPTISDSLFFPSSVPMSKLPKIPKLKGTSEELKAGRLLPQQAKDNECERILAKIAVHDDWVKSCWSEAKQNKKAAPVLDDETERNNILQVQEELRKLGTDRERRDYFQKKHRNSRRADPAENLSSFSWRPPGEEDASSETGNMNVAFNRDDILRNNSRTVCFEDWRREMVNKIARNVVNNKGLEADEEGIQELALYFAHVRAAQDESQSFWAAYLNSLEMSRDQVDLALEVESHVSSYLSCYEGHDNFRCALCGKPHRFNF